MSKDESSRFKSNLLGNLGCLLPVVIAGAVGFNALFSRGGYVDESEGSTVRLLIGSILGLLFGLMLVLED